jgi:GT2 family glycosyltransferase
MELAVIVVNYNTRELLRRCLASIAASPLPEDARLQVVVVDNASHDGSAELVAAEFPSVRLVAAPANLGFTGGNNLALRLLGFPIETADWRLLTADPEDSDSQQAQRAEKPSASVSEATSHQSAVSSQQSPVSSQQSSPPDFVLLLNADAELQDDALRGMAMFLAATPDAGACGAHLCYGNGAFQHGAFRFPGLVQIALDLFPLNGAPGAHRLHNSRFNGRYPARLWQSSTPFPVDFVLGAALMVRGAAIRQVGGLDDGFFMYCEEMDWCLRLAEAGWRVYAVPTAHVLHHEGQSSRQVRWTAYERLWRSRLRFYRKYARRYPPGFQTAVRGLLRLGAAWQARAMRRSFGAGAVDGQEAARALAAYAAIARL